MRGLAAIAIAIVTIGCIAAPQPALAGTASITSGLNGSSVETPTPTPAASETPAPTQTPTQAPTEAPTQTATPEPSSVPTDPAEQTWTLVKIAYLDTVYELVDGVTPTPISFERYRDVYKFAAVQPAPTAYVKYPWSATVYGVTFWQTGADTWQWDELTFPQYQKAHYPAVRNAGWILGSYYYQWSTSAELFVQGDDGVVHKLNYSEWADSGFQDFERLDNVGFQKLSWSAEIGGMNDIAGGQGAKLSYDEWAAESFPTPQVVQRFPGDQFYRSAGDPTVVYAGPLVNRAVSYPEWAAAGFPAPDVHGSTAPSSPTVSAPARPGDKDCGDFATRDEAQKWFNTYYPTYGDIAKLDADNDRLACETLR